MRDGIKILEHLKGFLRKEDGIPWGMEIKETEFCSLTFVNHSYLFVCGDRSPYVPEETKAFLEEGEV